MRMNKGAILASMVVIALASVLAGAGTMAYFSSTRTAGITFTSGTPNLKLSLDGTTWSNSLTVSPPVWAPGDTYAILVWVKNVGDIGLLNLYVTGSSLSGNTELSDVIYITKTAYTDTIGWVYPPVTYWEKTTKFGNGDGTFTLWEFTSGTGADPWMKFCWGDGSTDYLPVNVVQGFYIEFTFYSGADNSYQGKAVSFNIVFVGSDTPFTPVWVPP